MTYSWSRTRRLVSEWVRDGTLPVAVIGVTNSEGTVLLESFSAPSSPVDHDSVFDLFSVTKPFTALAAMRAVEDGRLDLLEPLASAVPDFGSMRGDQVQLHHLLSHTAGIAEKQLDDHGTVGDELLRAGQVFMAGTRVQYTSVASTAAAAMTEWATGIDIERSVLDIVGTRSGLSWDRPANAVPIVNVGDYLDYERHVRRRHPGAGMYGSAPDLLEFGRRILLPAGPDRVVAPSTLQAMLSPRTADLPRLYPFQSQPGQEWGLGWNLRGGTPGILTTQAFGHGGMSGVEWWLFPEDDLVLALMTNVVDATSRGFRLDRLCNTVLTDAHSPA